MPTSDDEAQDDGLLLQHPDFWTVLLTVPEVAERLGLSRAKTFALVSDGSIPSRKIGSARRVLLADLARYIAGLGGSQGEPVTPSADNRSKRPEGAREG